MNEKSNPSQTAPIDEYRVLWTTQKKQKLKKWHDGFLRFHKFNKRMLVYDDARHLVADMYLRGQDAIGEGDDLEFENHLVTIEDFKGTVVQDLTPLFSPAIQRKQQIQAGIALLNSPTPNQANRRVSWRPSHHATPTPQRRPIAAARPPQTPAHRRPINTPSINLQQSIESNNNYPLPPTQNKSGPAQQAPPTVPVSVYPPQRLSLAPRPSLLPIEHSFPGPDLPQRPNPQTSSNQEQWSNPASITHPGRRLPFRSSLSPSRQPNPHPQPCSPPRQGNGPLHPSPPRAKQGPSIAAPDFNNYSGPVQLSSNTRSLASPRGFLPLPPSRSKHDFSYFIPSSANKHTTDAGLDVDSDSEIFGPPPDFQVSTSPPTPAPLSRLNSAATDPVRARAKKRPSAALSTDTNPRAFRLPSKRKTTVSEKPQLKTNKARLDQNDVILGPDEYSEEDPVFEPLVSTGVLQLGNTTKRKRNKLLCQRPLNLLATAKTLPVRGPRKQQKKNPAKNSKLTSIPKPPSLDAAKDVTAVEDDSTKHTRVELSVSVSQASKRAGKYTEVYNGNSKASEPNARQDHRIEEEEDTIEYQQEHDIGPWSSEAFDLFDWRPPNMNDKK